MTRPTPHKKTGIYWFRKGVPERLRPLVGKREVKISLGTRDPEEAKLRHAETAVLVEREWRKLIAEKDRLPPEPVDLPKETLTAMAGEIYRDFLAKHERDPGEESEWKSKLFAIQQSLDFHEREPGYEKQAWGKAFTSTPRWVAWRVLGNQIQKYLDGKGIALKQQSFATLCVLSAGGLAQAYKVLIRRTRGDYGPDPRADRFPALTSTAVWQDLYDGYVEERKPSASSIKRAKGVFRMMFGFFGHDVPALVTEHDAVRWKEKRIKEVALQTVRDADLAHPQAFFNWAKKNKKIATDPFADVEITLRGDVRYDKQGKRKIAREEKGFTAAEADKILRATLVPPSKRMTKQGAAARRWVPWICAYTGARVNEIAQLRPEDVFQREDTETLILVWMIRITPEAGSTKDHNAREVAVHPHLIEQGFVSWAGKQKGERLFYDPGLARGGTAANPQSRKVGQNIAEWVRSKDVGVTDRGVAPNHGWRHRVRSQLLAAKIQEQIINRIDGHAAENVGQKYGTVWPGVCLEAISAIPTYRVGQ